ncbi:MAG: alanine--tRNA ligase [Gammaproteobacteria bacterium RIFCSPHIGHO2_12_FULL_42_10]|nr:MAG: alanine--tRNA ligase [Gammaproteobacteria bacterium RIFCSPHIGHO2_12_FULL_42_10]
MTNKKLSSQAIRQSFLDYFHSQNHEIVASSSLIPTNDPTLLFTNAGMVQFKDVFLGIEKKPYSSAASAQRCIRAGGKHNDLERVGYTARHHTFFEMLGNFSFGAYFKREAIRFAWDFLTQHLHINPEKLWVTVYEKDQEAEDIWLKEMKIDPSRFSRCGDEENFWSMGPTGPCGPCTEIFYDHGSSIPGDPPGSGTALADGDRYIEIWNLVFMQYDRANDGTLTPLPKPAVDTGMGLERITAVMQGVQNNYDTDLFQPLIQAIARIADIDDFSHFSLRVIADHIRAACFLIADNIIPSNEGRGYVLRRIIRRALRHGNQLGLTEPFFYQLVAPLSECMGSAYPCLIKQQTHIADTLRREEMLFAETLQQGLKLFEQATQNLKGNVIPGETIFKLYDTYGFPADLTADIARERHLVMDTEGFLQAMSKQRERSRKTSHFTTDYLRQTESQQPTQFTGYETTKDTCQILAIYQDGQAIKMLEANNDASIVLDRTPFYAESGGQVGDQGTLKIDDHTLFEVLDTTKQGQCHIHRGRLQKGVLHVGETVLAQVDDNRRQTAVLNHTATHLLHHILRQVLGKHVIQKGSLVAPDRLRFDFSHGAPVTKEELHQIEQRVNAEIRANHHATIDITSPEDATKKGAMALFGEKYGNEVRVVHFGSSVELCGGTHADATGDIGLFQIINESGVAQGIRRIEAVTGNAALQYLDNQTHHFQQTIAQKDERIHQLEKNIEQLQEKMILVESQSLMLNAKKIGNIAVLATIVPSLDSKGLRLLVDDLKQKLKTAIVVLATIKDNKAYVVSGVTNDLVGHFDAKDILNHVMQAIDGKSGGRCDLAQGGGNRPEALAGALETLYVTIDKMSKM